MHNLVGHEDYRPGPYSVKFPAGKTRFSFSNRIVKDDIIVEEDEYFTLFINPSSLPSGIVLGDHSRTTVIIDDDDCKYATTPCIHAYMHTHACTYAPIHACTHA